MGYVSKFENDQERLYEAASSGKLSYLSISKKELEKTRLKIEIENLQKFLALVRCALGTTKIQTRELEKQNSELKAEVSKLQQKIQNTERKSWTQIQEAEAERKAQVDSILDEKKKQLEALMSELDKYRFSEFKSLYEQQIKNNKITVPSKFGESKVHKAVHQAKAEGFQLNPVLPLGFDL